MVGMWRFTSSILAVALLALAGLLGFGYVGQIGLGVSNRDVVGIRCEYQSIELASGRGQLRLWVQAADDMSSRPQLGVRVSRICEWHPGTSLDEALWGFSASLGLPGAPGLFYELGVPLWVIELMLLTFPLSRLRFRHVARE